MNEIKHQFLGLFLRFWIWSIAHVTQNLIYFFQLVQVDILNLAGFCSSSLRQISHPFPASVMTKGTERCSRMGRCVSIETGIVCAVLPLVPGCLILSTYLSSLRIQGGLQIPHQWPPALQSGDGQCGFLTVSWAPYWQNPWQSKVKEFGPIFEMQVFYFCRSCNILP